MSRVRDDDRFKTIGPEDIILPYRSSSTHLPSGTQTDVQDVAEVWFDWAFVEFWKSNYCELHT